MECRNLKRIFIDYIVRPVTDEDDALLQKKLEDHRLFASAMYILGAFLGAGLWVWDYVTDPVGARHTLHLRALYLVFLGTPWLFARLRDRKLLAAVLVAITLFTEAVYVEILTRLNMGMVYGIGGFMYYMLLPPLAFQAFSLRTGILFVLSALLLPHLMAWAGLAPGFEHLHYAVLLWPAGLLAILVQFVYAKTYKARYDFEQELEKISATDALTGLWNRRVFMEALEKEWNRFRRTGEPFTLMILDIDFFKNVNDTYGHPIGDRVIARVARLLKEEVRDMDLPARIGGEEFAVILPRTNLKEALQIAERIKSAAAQEAFETKRGEHFGVTLSIGLAVSEKGAQAADVIRRADDAMYLAKRRGRNRVEYCAAR
ncbi:GGDEF domain-containing protein [Hydrogenimonas sp.]